ncbi:CpsD/CapB family tyrosine-protein kinase [Niveispirillum sp. KHB5.9]|uniref:CpsD/CapB family tyrosine-protein kinase n=1 Tax=Niveispirillum sp. KHB5.9 TaxID=3400269 RepID=UPI003A8A7BD9
MTASSGRLRLPGITVIALLSGLGAGMWLGVAVGVAGGVAVLLAGLVLSRTPRGPRDFQRPDEIEAATDLTVMASLPELLDADAAMVQVLRDPASPLAGSLRTLYTTLLATSPAGPPLTVALGSAEAGEGRSLLAATLGRLLASRGHRVLLIDADWRHPDQHRLFQVPNLQGLAELLAPRPPGLDEVVRTDPVSGLDLIPAGTGRLGARRLLSNPMKRLLSDLTGSYELVLIDLPPVLAATDVLLLSRIVDRILFAIRWKHTRRGRAMGALARLRKVRGQVAGIVLTRVGEDTTS